MTMASLQDQEGEATRGTVMGSSKLPEIFAVLLTELKPVLGNA
jgi:hypothetical protein